MSSKTPGNHHASTSPASSAGGSDADPGNYLEALLAKPSPARPSESASAPSSPRAIDGVVLGRLAGVDASGRFLVQFPGAPGEAPLPAVAAVALDAGAVGRPIALTFLQGDPNQPLILGLLHVAASDAGQSSSKAVEVRRDGDRLVLSADREIVLRCGESSITLTKAGKVLIRGKYLLSRSDGVNRIKGGAVQIN